MKSIHALARPQGRAAGQAGLPTTTAADEAPLVPDASSFADNNAPPPDRPLEPGSSDAPAMSILTVLIQSIADAAINLQHEADTNFE